MSALRADDIHEVWRARITTYQSQALNFNVSSSLCYEHLSSRPGVSAAQQVTGAPWPHPPTRQLSLRCCSRQMFSLPVRVLTVIMLIALSGDVQLNPGPLHFGSLNCCSVAPKIALIHDLINDHNLDLLFLSETWFTSETPQSVLLDVAPSDYATLHVVRPTGVGRPARGRGLAALFRESLPVRVHHLASKLQPTTFEFQLLRVTAANRCARLPTTVDVDGLQLRRRVCRHHRNSDV